MGTGWPGALRSASHLRFWPFAVCLGLPILAIVTAGWANPTLIAHVPPALVVEHPKNEAAGIIHLRNDSTSPEEVYLTAGDFEARNTKKLQGATVAFSVPGGSARGPVYQATLSPHQSVAVNVAVSNVWEAGESTATLLNHGRQIGTLRALKYRVPLGVRILGTGDNPPVLAFQRGVPRDVTLKNDDGMTYHLDWQLTIGSAVATGKVVLPPNGARAIRVVPADAWFSSPVEGFFKDETKEGTLALRFDPSGEVADPGLLEQPIPVRVRLAYWSSPWLHPISMLVVFLALLGGGLCSLLMNQWFPNRLRRLDLEERLGDIAVRTRNLSSRVDSSLRIVLRVERFRLHQLLSSRYAFSPEMVRVLSAGAQAVDRLEAKLALLERIDRVGGDLQRVRLVAPPTPPTLTEAVEERLRKAAHRLCSAQPNDGDLQEAAKLVTNATERLTALDQANGEFVQELIKRFHDLRDALGASGTRRKDPKCQAIEPQLRGLFEYIDGPAPADPLPRHEYFEHDMRLLRLDLVDCYLRQYRDLEAPIRSRLEQKGEPGFLAAIGEPTQAGFVDARRLLREMCDDNIYVGDVEQQILDRKVRIIAQPAEPRPQQAVELSAVFADDKYNSSAARDAYVCLWTFEHADSHGRPMKWQEPGWTVHHFFPTPGAYTPKASFQRRDGSLVADQTKTVTVIDGNVIVRGGGDARFGARTWIEAVRFAIVLFATILGLLGGAREHLMKLDVLAGLVAVFLIGFGADAVKNMLVDRGPTAEPARK